MSSAAGPSIATSRLVLNFDMANTQKSWLGKPTTNLVITKVENYTGWSGAGWWMHPGNTTSVTSQTLPDGSVGLVLTATTLSSGGLYGYNGYALGAAYINGTQYTASFWAKSYNGVASLNVRDADAGGTLSTGVSGITDTWQRFSFTWIANASTNMLTFTGSNFSLYNVQLETTSFATPFVAGTRSNTQSVLDLTGNHTLSATSLTYASSNTFSFTGASNNNITASISNVNANSTSRTWEAWVTPSATQSTAGIFGHVLGGGCTYYCNGGVCIASGNYQFNWFDNVAYQFLDSGVPATIGVPVHIVGVWDGASTTAKIYINGILKATGAVTNLNYGGAANLIQIGYLSASGNYYTGAISNIKYYYNRALTAGDVYNNFNALRSSYTGTYQNPAPNAAAIRSLDPGAYDGNYWYQPPGYTTPILLYTQFTNAPTGKGYVLVARGRESTDWWNTAGQNTTALTADLLTSNTPIAVCSSDFVNRLIGGNWNLMKMLVNRLNLMDSWYFQGTTSATFSWTYFSQNAATVSATATKYNYIFKQSGVALNYATGVQWTDTLNYGNGNNADRTFTWTWGSHGGYQGWSGGQTANPAGSYQFGSEGHAIELVNCFIEC
jgi:hypothetical protein